MNKSKGGSPPWVEGELRLSGIDNRMIDLLTAIAETGSISQAAKQCRLSYKGAWQIIERANNTAPSILISTATGGTKGGGAQLTETGRRLLDLFCNLHAQHQHFLDSLNGTLINNPEIRLLMQRLAVKTSVRNQLFGTISAIYPGAVNDKVVINLPGDMPIKVMLNQSAKRNLKLKTGTDAVLLINSADIIIVSDSDSTRYSASNNLPCTIIRIQQDEINAEVSLLLANGETLTSVITQKSAQAMELTQGKNVRAIFKSNAPVLGIQE